MNYNEVMAKTQSRRSTPPERHYHRGLPPGAATLAYPGLLFLWQRWLEALDNGSQVSVQAPTTGARAILREWIELRDRAKRETQHVSAALEAVEGEAFGVQPKGLTKIQGTLSTDPILHDKLDSLAPESPSLPVSHTGNEAGPNVVEARREAAAQQLQSWIETQYLQQLIEELEAVLFPSHLATNPSGRPALRQSEVARIDALATAMVSDALARGFSGTFLRRHARVLVLPNDIQQDERARFKGFVTRLQQPPGKTIVLLKVQAGREFWDAWPANAELVWSRQLEALLESKATPSDPSFGHAGADGSQRFVVWTGLAMDRPSATVIAVRAFERICDFVWAKDPSIPDPVLLQVGTIRQGNSTRIEVVGIDRTEAVFRPPRHSAARQARPFAGETARIAAVTRPEDSDETFRARQRIIGALRAARAATGQKWTENRIATLWTALEVLAHEEYGPHIIERVTRSVVPFVVAGKVRDLTDDVAQYLLMSPVGGDPKVQDTLGDLLSLSSLAGRAALLGKLADEQVSKTIIHACEATPLIGWRIEEFHKVVVDGRSIASRVIRSAQRVDWQLRRIYRHRNDHLHGGRMDFAADRLHEHLYLYVMTMLDPIARALQGTQPARSLEEVVGYVDGRVQSWLQWMLGLRNPIAKLGQREWERLYSPPF